MKWFAYIKYFAYLAWNWNIPIAWRIIREEVRGEKIRDPKHRRR